MPYLVCSPWLYVFSIGEKVAKFTKKGGGLNLVPNLQKRGRGLNEVLIFKGGLLEKKGDLFQGWLQFLHTKYTKIWNTYWEKKFINKNAFLL